MPRPLTVLDLDRVRTFVNITRLGGFTRAAELIGVGQSTISQQILRLEEALDVRLFERSRHHVELTEAGERFLIHAEHLLAANDAAVADLREPRMTGRIRFGAIEDLATTRLPDILARFVRAYPAVTLETTCDLAPALLDGLAAGRLDLVLVDRDPGPRPERGAPVWRDELLWVGKAPKDGPVPLILAPEPCPLRRRATAALDSAGLPWRVAFTSPALAGRLAAARAGLGVAIVPRALVPESLPARASSLPRLGPSETALLDAGAPALPTARLKAHLARALG